MNIVSNTDLQKNIGKITKTVENDYAIVNTRGKPTMVLVPYFSGSADFIDDYMESYFLSRNADKIQTEAKTSLASGLSDLEI